jgi:hypothetical protein
VPPHAAASFICALSPTLVEHVVNFMSYECGIYEVFYCNDINIGSRSLYVIYFISPHARLSYGSRVLQKAK